MGASRWQGHGVLAAAAGHAVQVLARGMVVLASPRWVVQ